jgi:DNA-binding PadR family transcriptional regulator
VSKIDPYAATTEATRPEISLVDFSILGLLHRHPMHGYEVARYFAQDLDLGLVVPLELATVYGVLKDLQGRGLIEGRREIVGRRPPRVVFSLQPSAEVELACWLQEPVRRLRDVRSVLLVKLYFCRRTDSPQISRLLDAQIGVSRSHLEALLRRRLEAKPASFEELVCSAELGLARSIVTWLELEAERACYRLDE